VSEPYTAESDAVLGEGAIDFAVDKDFAPEKMVTITTREGDYDPNGHVNNTVFLEYLDTLIKRGGIADATVARVGIQFLKEIGRDVHSLRAGLVRAGKTARFRFYGPMAVYAAGFVTIGETE
jgi:hypothetical protein